MRPKLVETATVLAASHLPEGVHHLRGRRFGSSLRNMRGRQRNLQRSVVQGNSVVLLDSVKCTAAVRKDDFCLASRPALLVKLDHSLLDLSNA